MQAVREDLVAGLEAFVVGPVGALGGYGELVRALSRAARLVGAGEVRAVGEELAGLGERDAYTWGVGGGRGELDPRVADDDLAEVHGDARHGYRLDGRGPDLVDAREVAVRGVLRVRHRDADAVGADLLREGDGPVHRVVAGDGGGGVPGAVGPHVDGVVGRYAVAVGDHGDALQGRDLRRGDGEDVGEDAERVVVPEGVRVAVDRVGGVVGARLSVVAVVARVRRRGLGRGAGGPGRSRGGLRAPQDGSRPARLQQAVGVLHVPGRRDDPHRADRARGRPLHVPVPTSGAARRVAGDGSGVSRRGAPPPRGVRWRGTPP